MTLKKDAKFEQKWTLGSKNGMRNLMRGVARLKICTLMYYVCGKYIMFKPKKHRLVMCHNTEK